MLSVYHTKHLIRNTWCLDESVSVISFPFWGNVAARHVRIVARVGKGMTRLRYLKPSEAPPAPLR